MKIRNYLWVALSALFLTSCGSDAETSRPLEDYVSSYINVSEDVVAFGKIRMKDILDKSDYKSNLLLNSIIGDQEKKFTPLIKMENSVYYTMSGPMKEDGAPTKMTFFIEVQDEEGLKAELKSMGYDLDEKDGISYSGEDDVVIGIRGNLAIIEVSNKPENKDILAGFKLADGDKGKGKVEEILKSKGDVVLGMDLMALYKSSDGDLADLPASSKKELEKLTKGSYIETIFQFENGKAIIETKNHFNSELKKKMFFTTDSGSMLKKMGSGAGSSPRMGFALNVDSKKMNALMETISPNMIQEMSPEVALGMMMSGASSIDQAISGKLGVLVFAEPDEYGMETQFSGYLGLEPKGRKLVEGYVSQLAMIGGGLKADMTKDGVSFSTSEKQGGALKLPAIAKNFGKSGMSFFLNLEGLDDTEAVAEMMFMEGGESILSVSKSIYMEYGNDGGKLIIEAKKGNENILKQMLQGGIEAFQGQMSGFAI